VKINAHPVEVDNGIPFTEDQAHVDYDAAYVSRWWRILLGAGHAMDTQSARRWPPGIGSPGTA
jgi:hypothetical protein